MNQTLYSGRTAIAHAIAVHDGRSTVRSRASVRLAKLKMGAVPHAAESCGHMARVGASGQLRTVGQRELAVQLQHHIVSRFYAT